MAYKRIHIGLRNLSSGASGWLAGLTSVWQPGKVAAVGSLRSLGSLGAAIMGKGLPGLSRREVVRQSHRDAV
jgi:hypothetical protein